MTDDRPRPQYGEYASDAEQASALERSGATPHPDLSAKSADSTGQPTPPKPGTSLTSSPGTAAAGPGTRGPAATRLARPQPKAPFPTTRGGHTAAKLADRTGTIFLLSFGFVYLLGSSGTYLNLASGLGTLFDQMGIGHYTPTSQTSGVGIGIIVGQALIWLVVAAWSYRRIVAGRTSWWVPLIGAIASVILTATLLGILLAGDPAFLAYATRT